MKIFGTKQCGGCTALKALMDKKGVNYTFYDIAESDGLAELAEYGLADETAVPIVVKEDKKLNLDSYVKNLETLPDKKEE